ncbi:MAG: HDOD domain-containing protein [Pyrinomonadaceae bacterium]
MAFVDFATFVKIDFTDFDKSSERCTSVENELRLFAKAVTRNPSLQLIGSGLDTKALYSAAFKSGCALFQGDYFVQPDSVVGRDIQAFKLPFLKLLKEIQQQDVDFQRVERTIKQDVALSYKLLRFVNSAATGRCEEVKSVQSALSLLGERELKRWVTLVGVSGLAMGKPKELLAKALMRARFCEELAPHANLTRCADDLFMIGLFSLLDVLLDRPLADIFHGSAAQCRSEEYAARRGDFLYLRL